MLATVGILVRGAAPVVVGCVLLYSGLVHLWQPFYFGNKIAAYPFAPAFAVALGAGVLPAVQIVVGIALMRQTAGATPAFLATGLLVVFALAQITAVASGNVISCGCFGFQSKPIGPASIAFTAGLAVLSAIYLVAKCRRRPIASYG